MSSKRLLATVAVASLLLGAPVMAAPVQLARLAFSGTLAEVTTDTGTGQLAGSTVGAVFSGTFTFSMTTLAGPPDFYPFGADYLPPGLASLERAGGPVISGTGLILTINDNEPLNPDPADLINALVGPVPPAVAGMPTDAWSLSAIQAGGYRGADDTTFNGVQWDIIMLSLTDTLYDSLALRLLPPAFGDVQVRALLLTEGDALGNPVFEGIVLLDNLAVVPVPPALWLLVSGLAVLVPRRQCVEPSSACPSSREQ
jgi:hypothetical protein